MAILNKMRDGRAALIKKDGGEMLIAIVLDKPLAEAQGLVDDPDAFIREIAQIMHDKHSHPVIAQMVIPDVRDDLPPSESATGSSNRRSSRTGTTSQPTQPQPRFQKHQNANAGYARLAIPMLLPSRYYTCELPGWN